MLYQKALQLSVGGYSIIPLKKDKKPIVKAWKDFQTTAATDEMIEQWWDTYPKSNIGIITGAISGITVVDIDTGGDTVVPLDTFPETYTVKTPSGGYHLYYKYDATIKQTANTYPQYPHLDIRNDGGYVVGPGSDNGKGGKYEVVNNTPPIDFPVALFKTARAKKGNVNNAIDTSTVVAKIKKVEVLKEGEGRNHAMCSILGTLLKSAPASEYSVVKTTFMAIGAAAVDPLPVDEMESIWNSIGARAMKKASSIKFMLDAKKNPLRNLENIRKILMEDDDFLRRCVFDTFLQKYLYRGKFGGYRDLCDSDEITLTREISMKYEGFEMTNPTMLGMVLRESAQENSIDAAKDWIESITWDGESRLDTWLCNTYNVEDNEYHRAVGSNWLKGMAKRIVVPGCQFDYVLVIEGEQGIRKSSSFAILGGDWYHETTESPDNKDFFMSLQGNLIIEFSEGETLSRGEIKKLKAVITTKFDKYRSPYERNVQTHPRRCVFAMTTNQSEYLKDETGNRRWLPVAAKGIVNTDWLTENRDQLMAEALHRVTVLKETTYEFPAVTAEEQAKRQVVSPNADRVKEWYYGLREEHKRQGVTPHMVFVSALGMAESQKFSRMDSIEITNILTLLKLEQRRVRISGDGTRVFRWFEANVEIPKTFMTDKEIKVACW